MSPGRRASIIVRHRKCRARLPPSLYFRFDDMSTVRAVSCPRRRRSSCLARFINKRGGRPSRRRPGVRLGRMSNVAPSGGINDVIPRTAAVRCARTGSQWRGALSGVEMQSCIDFVQRVGSLTQRSVSAVALAAGRPTDLVGSCSFARRRLPGQKTTSRPGHASRRVCDRIG